MSDKAKQVTAAIMMAAAVGDAIRDLGSIPIGHLYAQLMGRMSLDTYNGLIAILKQTNLVEEKSNLLTWVGPKE